MEKRDKKYVGRLERVLFKRVTLPPLDIHPLPTSQSQLNLFNNTILNTLGLITTPSGRPRYFKGKEKTSQPKMPVSLSTLSTQPTRTKTDLAKLPLNLRQLQSTRITHADGRDGQD